MNATARRLGTGEVEVALPDGPKGAPAALALRALLGELAVTVGRRRFVVPFERAEAALAIVEWYFGEVAILEPEPPKADVPPTPAPPLAVIGDPLSVLTGELRERAFRALAKVLHPDAGGSDDAFTRLVAWRGERD